MKEFDKRNRGLRSKKENRHKEEEDWKERLMEHRL